MPTPKRMSHWVSRSSRFIKSTVVFLNKLQITSEKLETRKSKQELLMQNAWSSRLSIMTKAWRSLSKISMKSSKKTLNCRKQLKIDELSEITWITKFVAFFAVSVVLLMKKKDNIFLFFWNEWAQTSYLHFRDDCPQ